MNDSWSSPERREEREQEASCAILMALMLGARFQDNWAGKPWSTIGDPTRYHTQHEAAEGFLEIKGVIEPKTEHRRLQLNDWYPKR